MNVAMGRGDEGLDNAIDLMEGEGGLTVREEK